MRAMPSPDWKHLGEVVVAERDRQRLSQADVQARGGPSTTLLRQIEKGTNKGLSPRKKNDLERALGWERGVVDELLDGASEPRRVAKDVVISPPPAVVTVTAGTPTVSVGDEDEDFEVRMRRPEGVTVEEWKRMKQEWQEELEFKLNRAARER